MEDNKNLVDPMVFDTEEESIKKKETWDDIYLRHPDFADDVIEIYNKRGEKGIKDLHKFINTPFSELITCNNRKDDTAESNLGEKVVNLYNEEES